MFDVISIGAATVDIFIKSKDLISTPDIIGLKPSSKNEINQSLISSGGGATNSAVSFSRLGLNSSCVSLIGQSYLNQYIYDDLKKNKVDDQFIFLQKSATTDFSVVLINQDGSRSILTNRGETRLESRHIPWTKIKKTKWFYITSLEGNLDLLEKIIGFAKENNIKICLNPGNRELASRRRITSISKMVDVLLLNKEESETFFDADFDDKEFSNLIHQFKLPLIAITNGRDGAYIFTDSRQFYSPIINTKPADETGAGDSFGSAFVAALIYHKTPQDALFWGIKNSASVVSYLGAKTGLLKLKQIKD
jgi:sugar/nucleoside kinase (ribokinase family)